MFGDNTKVIDQPWTDTKFSFFPINMKTFLKDWTSLEQGNS